MLRKHTLLEDFNSTKLLSIPLISEAYPHVPFKSQIPVYGIHHNTNSLSRGSSKPSIVSLRKRDTGGLSDSIKHFINRGKYSPELKGIRQFMKGSSDGSSGGSSGSAIPLRSGKELAIRPSSELLHRGLGGSSDGSSGGLPIIRPNSDIVSVGGRRKRGIGKYLLGLGVVGAAGAGAGAYTLRDKLFGTDGSEDSPEGGEHTHSLHDKVVGMMVNHDEV